jgi:predicted glutamine amidotransferase
MCEILLIASPAEVRLARALSWARRMERLGLAGFGWGVAWLSEDGRVLGHRDLGRLEDDPEASGRLAGLASTRVMIHLRRPSRLSTVQLADTQPFLAAGGRFAFCHNGVFARHEQYRSRFAVPLAGNADSEVGFRLFEELLDAGGTAVSALKQTVKELGGKANLAYLGNDGTLVVQPGHPENLIWRFSMGELEVAATELHSRDSSLFDLIFEDATNRRLLEGPEVMADAVTIGREVRSR